MENTDLIKDGAFKVVLPIKGARRDWVTKADGTVDDELWLHVEASGKERDSHGDRMSEKALEKMVEYCERGYDGGPVPFLDGHHRDLLASHLGDVYQPRLSENMHFGFDVQVKKSNPFALELFEDVLAGKKKHGASIAGIVHEAEIEEYEENEFGRLYHDIEIVEISRTSWPSWRPSFITLLAKNIGKSTEKKEDLLMRRNEIIGGLRAMKDNDVAEEVESPTAWVQDETGEWVEKITAPHGWDKKFSVSNAPWSSVKDRSKPCQFAIIKKKEDGEFSKSKSGYPHHMPNCTAINRGGTIAAGVRLIQAMKSEWPEIEIPPLDVLGEEYIEEVSRFSREELVYAARHILKHYRRDLKMEPPKNLVGIAKEFNVENLEDVVEIIRNLVEVVTMEDNETPAEVIEETPQEELVVEKVVELEGEPTVITDTAKTEEPQATEDTETATEPVVEKTQPEGEVETPVEDVAGETVEEPDVQRDDSDSLADAVDKRLLARKFSELNYAMNEMVRDAVRKKDVKKAHQILDDFNSLGKEIVRMVLDSDVGMYWTDEAVLSAFTDRVELAEGRLSVNRVVEMDAAIETLVANAVSLRDLMKKANVIDDTAVQRAAQESAQAVAQQISPEMQAMQERMRKVEEQNQEQLHEVARVLAEPQVAQPKGDGVPTVPQEQTPEQKRQSAWTQWGKSVPIANELMRKGK